MDMSMAEEIMYCSRSKLKLPAITSMDSIYEANPAMSGRDGERIMAAAIASMAGSMR